MKGPSLIHEALRDIATKSRVVRGDDGISRLGQWENPLPLVVEGLMVGRGALALNSCGAVCPSQGTERLVISERIRPREEGKRCCWNRLAIDVFAHVEKARKGHSCGFGPYLGGLCRGDVLPFDEVTNGVVREVGRVRVERVEFDIDVDPVARVVDQRLPDGRFAVCIRDIAEIGGGGTCKEKKIAYRGQSDWDELTTARE